MSETFQSDPRPRSAVSDAVGWSGLVGLLLWVAVARQFGMHGPLAAMCAVLACGAPMVCWSLFVDRVHRNPSTGIDWDRSRSPLSETIDITLVKIAGLWATWAAIGIAYCLGRWYWDGQYLFAMHVLGVATPFLLVASIPYLLWIDRRLVQPRDGAYAFGQFLLNIGKPDRAALIEHVRSWTVKGFFTAFMISIVPGNFDDVVIPTASEILANPVTLSRWLISSMFLVDVAVATVGYLLTMRPLDSHIRGANPYVSGWTAALLCYPPFLMMAGGGPFDYHYGTEEWSWWLEGHPFLLGFVGLLLVLLTGIYAWATVAFGLRFSNLTHRGVITHGPYRWSRHPAYVSKNLFWWIATMPFLVTSGNPVDMVRNCAMLGLLNLIYYWRARTEERHLMADPAYRAYAAWMDRNAPLSRLTRWLAGARPVVTVSR